MSEHKTKEKRLEVVNYVTNLSPDLVEKLQAIEAAKKKKQREELIEEMLDQQDAEVVGNLKNKVVTLVGGIGLVVFSCGLVALAIGGLCYHGWWGKIAVVFIILLEVCVTFCVCTFWLAGFVEALQLRDRFFSSGFHFSICDTTQHGNSCLYPADAVGDQRWQGGSCKCGGDGQVLARSNAERLSGKDLAIHCHL